MYLNGLQPSHSQYQRFPLYAHSDVVHFWLPSCGTAVSHAVSSVDNSDH